MRYRILADTVFAFGRKVTKGMEVEGAQWAKLGDAVQVVPEEPILAPVLPNALKLMEPEPVRGELQVATTVDEVNFTNPAPASVDESSLSVEPLVNLVDSLSEGSKPKKKGKKKSS